MTLQAILDELAERPGTGEKISVINPVTEELIVEFTDCGEAAVNEAVARAKASFEAGVWSELPGRVRAKVMWKLADLIDDDRLTELKAELKEATGVTPLPVSAPLGEGVEALLDAVIQRVGTFNEAKEEAAAADDRPWSPL